MSLSANISGKRPTGESDNSSNPSDSATSSASAFILKTYTILQVMFEGSG